MEKILPDTPEKSWGLAHSIPHHIESPALNDPFSHLFKMNPI
jgi:hypothetical protein